jgi:hypothetical protein
VSRSLPGRSRANPYPRRAHTPPTVGRGLPPTASSRGRVPTWSAKAAETHAVSERRPPQKSQGASPPPRRAARVLPRHRLGVPTVCLGRSGQGSRNPPETRQVAPLRGIPAPGYATETRATLEAPEGCPRVAYLREIETGGRGGTEASDPKRRGRVLPHGPRKTPTQSFAYSVPGRNFGRLERAAYLPTVPALRLRQSGGGCLAVA